MSSQCYRCQLFGHSQALCKMQLRCVRCGEEHRTTHCDRSRNEHSSCALCYRVHPAIYRCGKQAPKPRKPTRLCWTEATGGANNSSASKTWAIERKARTHSRPNRAVKNKIWTSTSNLWIYTDKTRIPSCKVRILTQAVTASGVP